MKQKQIVERLSGKQDILLPKNNANNLQLGKQSVVEEVGRFRLNKDMQLNGNII